MGLTRYRRGMHVAVVWVTSRIRNCCVIIADQLVNRRKDLEPDVCDFTTGHGWVAPP